jgi:hypothetical protein
MGFSTSTYIYKNVISHFMLVHHSDGKADTVFENITLMRVSGPNRDAAKEWT